MKIHFILGLMGLVLTAGSAQANSTQPNEHRLQEFNFSCKFDHDREWGECRALARIFAYSDGGGRSMGATAVESNSSSPNKLVVQCKDRLIYADDASVEIGPQGVVMRGISGLPALSVLKHAEREEHHRAFLNFGRDTVEGSCEIHSNSAFN